MLCTRPWPINPKCHPAVFPLELMGLFICLVKPEMLPKVLIQEKEKSNAWMAASSLVFN